MKYSFNRSDFRNLIGSVGERLVQRYIEESIIPTLLQNWDAAIFTSAWFGDDIEANKNVPSCERIYWRREEKFFISHGFCPTRKFLEKFRLLTKLLENSPDGFLVMIKKTNTFKTLKDALEELQLSKTIQWSYGSNTFDRSKHNDNERLAVVDGEIEVVEVKSGKSNLPTHQQKSYRSILKEGFQLRFFHVDVSSMAKNEFEIQEKLLTKPDEISTFPLMQKTRKKRARIEFRN
jgi:hypothetical protein